MTAPALVHNPETNSYVDRRALAACRKIGITYEQLATAPPISHHFNAFAWRRHQAGCPYSWLYYLRLSEAPEAKAVLEKVNLVREDARTRIPIEAYAIAAGVNPWRLYECLTGAAMRIEAQAGAFLIAVNQEEILAALIERAKDLSPDGDKAREQFLRMSGYMPVPKSAQMNITLVQQANANAAAAAPVIPPQTFSAPSPEDITRGLTESYAATQPALPPPEAIDVEVEAPEEEEAMPE